MSLEKSQKMNAFTVKYINVQANHLSTLNSKLKSLFQDLNFFLNTKKIISRLELRLKIKDLIATHNFSDSEKKESEELYKFPLLQFIFLAITAGSPFSIQSPIFNEKLEYKQIMFYYSHAFPISNELLENAHIQACQLQLNLLNHIVSKILLQVGYKIQESTPNSIFGIRDQFIIKGFLFCSILRLIDKINSLELTPNDVLLIPPGTSVKPFIDFYQQHSNNILLSGASVWLIDIENESINRFVGLPKDKEILSKFTRSQLATLIERNWRPSISENF